MFSIEDNLVDSLKNVSLKENESILLENTERMNFDFTFRFNFIKKLIEDKRVSSKQSFSECLIELCKSNYFELVELFLQYPDCVPYLYDSAIIHSCLVPNIESIKLLIQYTDYNFKFDFEKDELFFYLLTLYKRQKMRTNILNVLNHKIKSRFVEKLKKELDLAVISSNIDNF